MRKLIVLLLFSYQTNAQVPQGLNYQAVARTLDGAIMPTQNIGVRFSIIDMNINGTLLYSETHNATTNSYGLFTLAIGRGTPQLSTFSKINWSSGTDKFLKVEIAPAGDTNYQLQGTTQLLSVPYALYAARTNLLAGNNTIKVTNGNTIKSNYVAGEGINIKGNVISSNLIAGKGVIINGNSISSTTGVWITHRNGVYYPSTRTAGNVGIGTFPHPSISFVSSGNIPGIYEGNAALFTSSSPWHTAVIMLDSSVGINNRYTFSLGGNANDAVGPGNWGIFNHNIPKFALIIGRFTNNIGIGMNNIGNGIVEQPKSKLHVFNGDVNVDKVGSGIILKSPNGQCWRVTIDNAGNLVRTAITCPN